MSGSVTISSSGVPARLRSMPVRPWKSSCSDLAGVFFQVGARQAAPSCFAPSTHDVDAAALHHRHLVLADLVALGQVGVEVVLAREDRLRRDRGAHRQTEADGALDRAAVHHRQRARQRQVDRAGLRVGRGAERGAARRRRSCCAWRAGRGSPGRSRPRSRGSAVAVGVRHVRSPAGARAWKSVACWNACATCSSRALVEVVADQLQAHRHAAASTESEARRHAHAGQAGQARRQREDVGQVDRHRVVALLAELPGHAWAPPARRSRRTAGSTAGSRRRSCAAASAPAGSRRRSSRARARRCRS